MQPDGLSPALVAVRSVGALHGAVDELGRVLAEALDALDSRGADPLVMAAVGEAVHQAQQARASLAQATLHLRSVTHN